jgi:hypothetical protein
MKKNYIKKFQKFEKKLKKLKTKHKNNEEIKKNINYILLNINTYLTSLYLLKEEDLLDQNDCDHFDGMLIKIEGIITQIKKY